MRDELALLTLPGIWLSTLATFPNTSNVLMLAAVVDTELLAVHSAVHDALAGKVRQPSVLYLPGSWVPHCTLAMDLGSVSAATALALASGLALPLDAHLDRVGIVEFRPVRERFSRPLTGGADGPRP